MHLICKKETWKRNGELVDHKSGEIRQCDHCKNGERIEFKVNGRTIWYDVFLCDVMGRYSCVVG